MLTLTAGKTVQIIEEAKVDTLVEIFSNDATSIVRVSTSEFELTDRANAGTGVLLNLPRKIKVKAGQKLYAISSVGTPTIWTDIIDVAGFAYLR